MKGTNTIMLNQSSMNEALENYLDDMMSRYRNHITVTDVKQQSMTNDYKITFKIDGNDADEDTALPVW